MPRPSRTGAQRRPIVTAAGPTSVWEASGPHMRLSSPPKHRGSTSSGPTNCAELTTRASMASLPGSRRTHATSRPLNSRTRTAARQKARASAPSCGGRRFRGELAVIPSTLYCLGWATIVSLSMLSAASQWLPGGVLIAWPSRRCKELNSHERPTHPPDGCRVPLGSRSLDRSLLSSDGLISHLVGHHDVYGDPPDLISPRISSGGTLIHRASVATQLALPYSRAGITLIPHATTSCGQTNQPEPSVRKYGCNGCGGLLSIGKGAGTFHGTPSKTTRRSLEAITVSCHTLC